jgi:hypothetical protein
VFTNVFITQLSVALLFSFTTVSLMAAHGFHIVTFMTASCLITWMSFAVVSPVAFLQTYGFRWKANEDDIEEVMLWHSRQFNLARPFVIRGELFEYSPKYDSYHMNFKVSAGAMIRVKVVCESFDLDLAEIIDLGLGLVEIQDDCRSKGLDQLIAYNPNQTLTSRSKK